MPSAAVSKKHARKRAERNGTLQPAAGAAVACDKASGKPAPSSAVPTPQNTSGRAPAAMQGADFVDTSVQVWLITWCALCCRPGVATQGHGC